MAATRQTFERVASVLAGERALAKHARQEDSRIRIAAITYSIADVFAQENPRFDRAAFYRAAGMDA